MATKLASVLVAGDSHAAGYEEQGSKFRVDTTSDTVDVVFRSLHTGLPYDALDMIVTYPDGRRGINPWIETTIGKTWPWFYKWERGPKGESKIKSRHLVLTYGGAFSYFDPTLQFTDRTMHQTLFQPGFDFLLPERSDLALDMTCTILPLGLLREMYAAVLAPLIEAIAYMRETAKEKIWLVATPPPPEDNAVRYDHLVRNRVATSGGEFLLPNPAVALKLWLLVQGILKQTATNAGCGFIDCAPDIRTPSGFIKPEFVDDGFHGNKAYHRVMAQHIMSTVATAVAAT